MVHFAGYVVCLSYVLSIQVRIYGYLESFCGGVLEIFHIDIYTVPSYQTWLFFHSINVLCMLDYLERLW